MYAIHLIFDPFQEELFKHMTVHRTVHRQVILRKFLGREGGRIDLSPASRLLE